MYRNNEIKETLTQKIENIFNNFSLSLNTKALTKCPDTAHVMHKSGSQVTLHILGCM
jgi:hypothetical protein